MSTLLRIAHAVSTLVVSNQRPAGRQRLGFGTSISVELRKGSCQAERVLSVDLIITIAGKTSEPENGMTMDAKQ